MSPAAQGVPARGGWRALLRHHPQWAPEAMALSVPTESDIEHFDTHGWCVIRNVMSDLEELGLVTSPHTSSGRVPTSKGYRLFVDTMLKVDPDSLDLPAGLPKEFSADQPVKVLNSAAQLLSNLSQFVGVVVVPKRNSVFRHIEFLSLSERRVLIIIVSPDGDVQNRVIHTAVNYAQSELVEAANFLNANYAGLTMEEVRLRLRREVD